MMAIPTLLTLPKGWEIVSGSEMVKLRSPDMQEFTRKGSSDQKQIYTEVSLMWFTGAYSQEAVYRIAAKAANCCEHRREINA